MEAGTTLTDVSAVCPIPCINIFLGLVRGKGVVGVMDGGGHYAHRRVRSLSNTLHKHILRVGEGNGVVGVMDGSGHYAHRRVRSLSNTLHKHILIVGEGKGVVGVMDGGGHHTHRHVRTPQSVQYPA